MNENMRMFMTITGVGVVGAVIAAILNVLNDAGILIDEFITGNITMPELMAIVIIIFVLVGVILAVVKG